MRSATTRQCPGSARNSATPAWPVASMKRVANHRSMANTVRPIEPNGTRPSSTLRPDRRSQSSDPTPMPIENSASSSVTTCSSPPSTFFAKLGNCVRKVAP